MVFLPRFYLTRISYHSASSLFRRFLTVSGSPTSFSLNTTMSAKTDTTNLTIFSLNTTKSAKTDTTNLTIDLETYSIKDGLKVIERFFTVPLDYSKPEGEKIRIFARHVIPKIKAKTPEEEARLPFMLYLTGGPGFEIHLPGSAGYPGKIYEKGYQTLWLDQRGTGLSTALSPDTLPERVKTDSDIAEYLKHFRADNIVNDCEFIRKALIGDRRFPEERKWSIMGQSFGGFCCITYLSFFPSSLKEVFITGGLAPLVSHPDPVYEALILRVMKRNEVYYAKYPQDIKRVRDIMAYLDKETVVLPMGGRLTTNRWQHLGMSFGMHGGIDKVHQIVFRAAKDLEIFNKLSYKTLLLIDQQHAYDGNPLYLILHEALYCQGKSSSNWSASRVVRRHNQFSWDKVQSQSEQTPIYFTGEMIFPEMFVDYSTLRHWKGAAELLAQEDNWPALYDLDQLAKNEVKVNAATYFDDMYVDFNFAQDTAAKIKNTEQYITNQLVHDGNFEDPDDIMKKLFILSKREYN